MDTKTTNTTHKGKYFEQKAIDFLLSKGFTFVEKNYHAKKLGEIDIIVKDKEVYHFIEVKSGQNFEAVYNITPQKLYKLYRAINFYLKVKKLNVAYCVDAIIFDGEQIEYLENITL